VSAPRSALAALLGVLLGLSAPPAVVPLAEWLVLPGLAAWFALALSSARPLLRSYWFGCGYMAWFSWSIHHIGWAPYLGIVFVGGLYFVLGSVTVRAAPLRLRPLAFAVAVAGSFWLRAVMPDIYYPHGQPAHALWQWPSLMVVVALGGEPLMNFLLGWLAAAGLMVWRSWRVATVPWSAARTQLIAATVLAGAAILGGHVIHMLAAPREQAGEDRAVAIAAIEPGFHPLSLWKGAGFEVNYPRVVAERLVAPTQELLREPEPPDLILWPESSVLDAIQRADVDAGRAAILPGRLGGSSARLVVGANLRSRDAAGALRLSPSALLVGLPDGRILAYHDKQHLVPGGEFLPLIGLLPGFVAEPLRELCRETFRTPPDCLAGVPRPPLTTADGTPFGALICYDNAFPGPAAAQVEAGAEFLVVLSNEAWYRGGAELSQLAAMTVVRAIENVVPVVRCTIDGQTLAVDASGSVLAGLEIAPAPRPEPRILQVSIQRGAGRIPPMAWLRWICGPIFGLLVALAAAHSVGRWVRIRAANTALPAGVGSSQSGVDPGGS